MAAATTPPTARLGGPAGDRHAGGGAWRLLLGLALGKVVLHLPWLGGYGIHRDELYFLSCAARLDWGYADFAPLVAWLTALSRTTLGETAAALHVLPLFAGALNVVLVGLLVRALGGGRFAILLAAVCVLLGPTHLRTGALMHAPSFETTFWTGCSLALVHLVRSGPGPLWLCFGTVAGAGLLNKHTMLLFGFGVAVGLLSTPQRRQLRSRWLWLGLLCAILVSAPNLIWQVQNGFPSVAFAQRLGAVVSERISRTEFLVGQVLFAGPISAVVWIAGVIWLFRAGGRRFLVLGWVYVVVIGVLLWTGAKVYYSAPIYPTLLAAGAVAWEGLLRARGRALLVTTVVLLSVGHVPLALPVLPIERVDGYARAATLGLVANSHEVTGDLHDMFGWKEHARAVAAEYERLPPADRARCLLWGNNYGHSGCLERYWPEDAPARPPVASNHMSWHFFGPPPDPPGGWETMLALSWSRRHLDRMFANVEQIARSPGHPQALERDIPIFWCREPRAPLREVWPKHADL